MEPQPRPSTRHKIAEEILDRLAGYRRSLNNVRALQLDRTPGRHRLGVDVLYDKAFCGGQRAVEVTLWRSSGVGADWRQEVMWEMPAAGLVCSGSSQSRSMSGPRCRLRAIRPGPCPG